MGQKRKYPGGSKNQTVRARVERVSGPSRLMFEAPLTLSFSSYIVEQAEKLHFTPEQFGARLMGRWKSGKMQAETILNFCTMC